MSNIKPILEAFNISNLLVSEDGVKAWREDDNSVQDGREIVGWLMDAEAFRLVVGGIITFENPVFPTRRRSVCVGAVIFRAGPPGFLRRGKSLAMYIAELQRLTGRRA